MLDLTGAAPRVALRLRFGVISAQSANATQ